MFANDQFLLGYADGVSVIDAVTLPTALDADGNLLESSRAGIGDHLFAAHPQQIRDYLQHLWDFGSGELTPQPIITTDTPFKYAVDTAALAPPEQSWFHLIYAYILENTRAYEIFERVLQRFREGERLGTASAATRQWLQTTEALFYRQQSAHDHPDHLGLTSDVRSDGRAIRRNAYYRMFGQDLTHGTEDNGPYPFAKPKLANQEFIAVFESLLRELWVAIVHDGTTTADPTDEGAIIDLTQRLYVMLSNRRLDQTLRAEEFSAIATLDWLRLSLSYNSPIIQDLRANAASESERLFKMAERVGLPAHGRSQDYFELAAPLSTLLQGIEDRSLNDRDAFLLGFNVTTPNGLNIIITNWSSATGRVMKRQPQPVITQTA